MHPVVSGASGLQNIIVVTVAGIAQCRAGFPTTQVCLMEYITLRLDSTKEVEQWYVRHNYFYCLIT